MTKRESILRRTLPQQLQMWPGCTVGFLSAGYNSFGLRSGVVARVRGAVYIPNDADIEIQYAIGMGVDLAIGRTNRGGA